MTIVAGGTWDSMSDGDREILLTVLREAAEGCTQEIIKAENELADWFRAQGVTVNEVDRAAFREAVVPLHNGEAATWDQATYDRLQAIQ